MGAENEKELQPPDETLTSKEGKPLSKVDQGFQDKEFNKFLKNDLKSTNIVGPDVFKSESSFKDPNVRVDTNKSVELPKDMEGQPENLSHDPDGILKRNQKLRDKQMEQRRNRERRGDPFNRRDVPNTGSFNANAR